MSHPEEAEPERDGITAEDPPAESATPANPLAVSIDILTAPTAAFRTLKHHPTSLFPILLIAASMVLVTGWYFAVLDYAWYVDDTLSRIPDLDGSELEQAREAMTSLSQRNLMVLGVVGSAVGLLAVFVAQSGYLALVSALRGDAYRFRQWFSLVAWTSLPSLFVSLSMAVTILLNGNGQLSNYDLNALSLYSLGLQFDNESLNQLFSSLNIAQFWSLALLILGYLQWLNCSVTRAALTVLAPYLLIYGVWAYFALT